MACLRADGVVRVVRRIRPFCMKTVIVIVIRTISSHASPKMSPPD